MTTYWERLEPWNILSTSSLWRTSIVLSRTIFCSSLRFIFSAGVQRMPTPLKPERRPDHQKLNREDRDMISEMVLPKFKLTLREAEESEVVDFFWKTWSYMAEKGLLEECAIATGNESVLAEGCFRGEVSAKICRSLEARDSSARVVTWSTRTCSWHWST